MKLRTADYLSLSRIIFALLFIIFFNNKLILIVILALVVISDVLDGYIARRTKTASKFGALIDPMADKFFVITSLLLFLYYNEITVLQFFILIIRDIYTIIEVIINFLFKLKKSHQARVFGKIATTLQYFTIFALINNLGIQALLWLTLAFSVLAIIDYIRARWFDDK